MRKTILLILILIFSCGTSYREDSGDILESLPFNYFSSPLFKCWATGYKNYIEGSNLTNEWKDISKAIGRATDSVYDILSLGEGGQITLTFSKKIYNGSGYDFAVFENSFNGRFLELGFVEVSSNGIDFVRFDTETLIDTTVDSYGEMDNKKLKGFAGLHKVGYGTPFDLDDLKNKDEIRSGKVDLNSIQYIKIIDIIGDGREKDSLNNSIYDPYPTSGSAGFDIDAIGVYNCR